jgi:excisionase family DNA binding protein
MGKLLRTKTPQEDERQFRSVAEAARVFGVSEMTLYRAIRDGQFPAVRIMGRLIVPLKAIEGMTDAAVQTSGLVDAADWADEAPERQRHSGARGAP